ncbi:restriction endonuclease subunit S [Clostridium perfringens]
MNKKDVLKNLVEIDSGYAFKSSFFNDNFEGIPIIRIRDINSGIAETYYSGDYEEKFIVNNDDLLIGMDGNFKIRKWSGGKALLNQRVCRIKSISNKLSNEYLYRILPLELKFIEDKTSFVTVKHLSVKDINNIELIIPHIDIQNKIVKIIDKSQELIDNRKKQIEELDLLVKSKFIEMFGDPVTNLKKWDKVAIGEMFEIKTGATPSRKENSYWEGGTIPWVKTTELKEYIINETEEYITEDGFNNSSVNLLPKDTILIAMYGQGKTRGMTGKLGIEATTNQACAAILPNNNENMDFVWYQLRLLYDELRALGQGGSQPNLNTNLVKTYQLIFPPVELQNEFERFIKHIDKLKFEMEKSLKELEDNFNSLMQKAFKGELFN